MDRNEELVDKFRYLVGGYMGVDSVDEYELKLYVLKDIEKYLRDFLEVNPLDNIDYDEEVEKIRKEASVKTKLQDALIVLQMINGPMELVFIIKKKLKSMNNKK